MKIVETSFNFGFAYNTFWSCSFFFFLIIDLYFLIPAAIAQIFNPIAELANPIGIPSREANIEIEIHPVIAEVQKLKQQSVQYSLELHKPFCAFYSSFYFALFLQGNNFLF